MIDKYIMTPSSIKFQYRNMIITIFNTTILFIILMISIQQFKIIYITWNEQIKIYNDSYSDYQRICSNLTTQNEEFIDACKKLQLIINTDPFIRAIKKVIYNWNSCLTLSCTDLFYSIITNYEYNILFIITISALIYYIYIFIQYLYQTMLEKFFYYRKQATKRHLEKKIKII